MLFPLVTLNLRIFLQLTFQAIDEDGLQANCVTTGDHFIEGLKKLREKFDCIGKNKIKLCVIKLINDTM